MSNPRADSAHVVLSGFLYVIGGHLGGERYKNSVDYYDPSTNKWKTVASMRHERRQPAAHVSNGFIYVLGGRNSEGALQFIERFDPGENAWTEVSFILFFYLSSIRRKQDR